MFNSLLFSTLIGAALATPFLDQSDSSYNLFQGSLLSSGCSTTRPASCQNTSAVGDLCCFESPGGLLMQTQFWDTDPPTGPEDSWTIHGLWPDNCDGTFEQSCDPDRAYTDIADLLSDNGASDTLDFMKKFWVDINGKNERFWEHEWSKHGTCLSTLDPSCLPDGSVKGAEAVAFFRTVVRLFKTLPTYTFLSDAGIEPSSSKTYTLAQFISALEEGSGGFTPALQCRGHAVNGISWYFNLKGSIIDGKFIPIDAPESSSCPSRGLHYLPKDFD